MSDYFAAEITIPLSYVIYNMDLSQKIEEYLREPHGDNLSMDTIIEQRGTQDDYVEVDITGEPGEEIFCLKDNEARWGYFADIEELCLKNAIPFDRITYGDYEEGGDTTYWYRPWMPTGKSSATPNGVSHVSIDFIRNIIDSQPEEMSDETVLEHLIEQIYTYTHDSPTNLLKNWCMRGISE